MGWFWLWLLFILLLLVVPLSYGWGYRGWGLPCSRRRRPGRSGSPDCSGSLRWWPSSDCSSHCSHKTERMTVMSMFWTYPPERYYDSWYDGGPPAQTDGDIKARLVDRLRENPYTKDDDIKVDVKQGVVVLGGEVSTSLAKRAAADDAWDTPAVVDVSNQLKVPVSA